MASGFTFAISIFAASLCGILALVSGATFNLVNRCSYDVWPAISTNGGSQRQESSTAPFGISPNSSNTLHLPDTWSGQIWGRTGCSFDSSSGINRCEIGECGSGFQCLVDGRTLSVTLAEFTIGGFNNLSFYDLSLVGGFNLPLSVSPSQKSASKNSSSFTCGRPSCTADVIQHCPPQLRVSNKSKILACSSACNAFQTDKYCCTGNFSSPSECVPTNYSRTFKNLCPSVYTYPFDDATSTFACPDSDFTLTFCSDNSFQSATPPLSPIPVITPSQSPGHGSRSPTIGQKPQPSGPSTHVGLIVGVCLGVIAIVGVGFVCLVWNWRYWEKDREAKIPGIGPRKFKYKELYSATKGFSPSELLGEGAHGQVYKGTLRASGSLVAVKKVAAEKGGRGMRELVSELNIISMLRHRNLTQLQGWCENKGEVIVVYDYMPNGSLDKVLFAHNGFVLDWQSRYGIVCGLATALLYLHDEGEKRVVHRDVKPSNIMLDANFEAKLGDFGLARLIDRDVTPRSSVVAGTFGYLAPEIATTRRPTAESDVFSFGIVALEVACGRQSFHLASESGSFFLLDKVRNLSKEGKIMEAADPRLAGNFDVEEMERLFYVGLAATDPNPNERPTMREVLNILTREAPAASNTEEIQIQMSAQP